MCLKRYTPSAAWVIWRIYITTCQSVLLLEPFIRVKNVLEKDEKEHGKV